MPLTEQLAKKFELQLGIGLFVGSASAQSPPVRRFSMIVLKMLRRMAYQFPPIRLRSECSQPDSDRQVASRQQSPRDALICLVRPSSYNRAYWGLWVPMEDADHLAVLVSWSPENVSERLVIRRDRLDRVLLWFAIRVGHKLEPIRRCLLPLESCSIKVRSANRSQHPVCLSPKYLTRAWNKPRHHVIRAGPDDPGRLWWRRNDWSY